MATTVSVPDVLVSTDWVAQHRNDPNVRVVEVDVDTAAYDQGHVPGSLGWNWTTELCDTLVRDIVPKAKLEGLLGRSGITPQTTIVLYGDNNNWFAAWAFWQLKVYGHQDERIMNGGRKKWLAEGRELDTSKAAPAAATYKADDPDFSIRAALIGAWGSGRWEDRHDPSAPHEAGLLRLSIDKATARLGWAQCATLFVHSSGLKDELTRTIQVVPVGFPRRQSASSTLSKSASHIFDLRGALPGSVEAKVTFYPSPLASMMAGLDSILQEPSGCFEQASSSNYPNVMVMRYLRQRNLAQPALLERASKLLDSGYQKIASYETPTRGYEWFGGDPGHEALTAYGLLQFHDMAKVHPVDAAMIELAVAFILGTAIAAVIKSFVDDVVMQIVAAIVGQPDFSRLTINLRKGAVIRYGAFLNTLITLVIVGLVLFMLVRAYNKMKRKRPGEVGPTELEVLLEIRDELRARAN